MKVGALSEVASDALPRVILCITQQRQSSQQRTAEDSPVQGAVGQAMVEMVLSGVEAGQGTMPLLPQCTGGWRCW